MVIKMNQEAMLKNLLGDTYIKFDLNYLKSFIEDIYSFIGSINLEQLAEEDREKRQKIMSVIKDIDHYSKLKTQYSNCLCKYLWLQETSESKSQCINLKQEYELIAKEFKQQQQSYTYMI